MMHISEVRVGRVGVGVAILNDAYIRSESG